MTHRRIRLLYIGNKLAKYGKNPTSVETVGTLLSGYYDMTLISDKKSQLFRFFDIGYTVIKFRRKARVVLIDTYSTKGFYFAFLAAFLCKLFSIPYISILRGGNLKTRLDNSPRMCRLVFRNAAILVAPSAFLLSVFMEHGYSNVVTIPNTIDISQYVFTQRTAANCRLLWVRAFKQLYNPRMAIDVLKELLKSYPDAELCMVGPDIDGSLIECRKYAQESKIDHKITFTGKLSKTEWHKISQNYDIFINTASIDNTPVSVIEAMALGLPVISTNVGGISYLLTDRKNSLLVKDGAVSDMVASVKMLTEQPVLVERLVESARDTAEQFDWSKIKFKWIEVIDNLLDLKKT